MAYGPAKQDGGAFIFCKLIDRFRFFSGLTRIRTCADEHYFLRITGMITSQSKEKSEMQAFQSSSKPTKMAALKLKQLQYESETWKRLLGFIADENIYLKSRLAEVLRDSSDRSLLDEAENFQSEFVQEDGRIGFLRNELAELDKLLVREVFEDGAIAKNVESKLNRIRHNMRNTELQFIKLKSEFNNYLAEAIS